MSKKKGFKKTVVLRAVNIPFRLVEPLALLLKSEQVQYEFDFCEQIPEQKVKNLVDLANKSDLDSALNG